MANFHRRFIPAAAQIMLQLFEALAGKPRTLVWDEKAFHDTKQELANATLLTHPCHDVPTSLTTDASDHAIGAVLQQFVNGTWEPLAFFRKKLRTPEQKYSAFDRELLALYLGIRHIRYFLEGRQFIAYTDHKPLTFRMSQASEPWSNHQQCHLSYISEFTTDIQHVPGKDNFLLTHCPEQSSMQCCIILPWQLPQNRMLMYKPTVLPTPTFNRKISALGHKELHFSVTYLLVRQDQLYLPVGDVTFSIPSTLFLTPQCSRPGSL